MKRITFKAAHSYYIKRGFRTSKRLIHLIAILTIITATLAVSSVRRGYAADTGTWHGEYFTIADPMTPGATPTTPLVLSMPPTMPSTAVP